MAKIFIKLHLYDRDHPAQHEIYFNTNHILSIEPVENHSQVTLANESEIEVEEKCDQILAVLQGG